MTPKISLCVICKPTDEEAIVLERCLNSVSNFVDEICITITGENKECETVAKDFNAKVSHFEWCDDFSKARNFNFAQATGDYILWLDTDDVLRGVEHLEKTIQEMEEQNVDIGICDYLYDFDEYNVCTVKHRKSRIIKNNNCAKWVGELHEDFIQNRQVIGFFIKNIQVIHLTTPERVKDSKQRNLDFAMKNISKDPKEPRNYWNLGNAYLGLDRYEDSLLAFTQFVRKSGSEAERFLAWHRMAGAGAKLGRIEEAIDAEFNAMKIKPWYPDSYLGLGEIYFNLGKFRKAKEFLVQGLSKPIPEDEYIAWCPRDYDFNPLLLLAKSYFNLSKPEEAKKCLKGCLDIYPDHPQIKKYLKLITKEINNLKKVDKICEEVKKAKKKEDIKKLIDTAPDELRAHPKLVHLRNIHFRKEKSSGKDLVIYCMWTKEEFDPDIVQKKGRGGSEEAVCHMSKRLADLGWNVVVYANCGHKERYFGKVLWKPFWEFNIRDKQDILIAWRHPMIFDYKDVNADKRYVWMHDVLKKGELFQKRLDNITRIFALSKAQRDLFPDVPDNKFLVTSNGIEPTKVKEKRDPYRLIYSSSYDRGLTTLLKLFPQIKKEVPKAELHIFYGWSVWDAIYPGDELMKKRKEEIIKLMKQDGVFEHGRVSQEQINKEYAKSSILAYPTEFFEISYISGMKAQAFGAIPITTNVAALDETIKYGVKVPTKAIYSDKRAQKEWTDAVIKTLKNPPTEEERKPMMDWANEHFNWDKVAKQWDEEFKK